MYNAQLIEAHFCIVCGTALRCRNSVSTSIIAGYKTFVALIRNKASLIFTVKTMLFYVILGYYISLVG